MSPTTSTLSLAPSGRGRPSKRVQPGRTTGVTSTALVTVLRAAGRAGVAVCLWGDPGIGKSSLITAAAAADDVPCEIVIGSLREPSDFAGLPVVTDDGGRLEPPSWAKRVHAAQAGYIFLDELSTSPPAVQAAMLGVALERRIGDLVLPRAVQVVAAANPPERAADGWDLSPPLANRFLHISYTPSTDGWIDGMTAGFSLPAAGWVAQPSRERRAIARAHVAAFIRCGPAPGDGPDDAGRRRTVRSPAPDHLTAASQALPLGRGRTLRLKPSITVEPMDSSSRLRLALIGAGWREAGAHLPGIDVPTDVYELVGHLRRGHRQSLRNGAGAHGYTSVRELIERERPDVV